VKIIFINRQKTDELQDEGCFGDFCSAAVRIYGPCADATAVDLGHAHYYRERMTSTEKYTHLYADTHDLSLITPGPRTQRSIEGMHKQDRIKIFEWELGKGDRRSVGILGCFMRLDCVLRIRSCGSEYRRKFSLPSAHRTNKTNINTGTAKNGKNIMSLLFPDRNFSTRKAFSALMRAAGVATTPNTQMSNPIWALKDVQKNKLQKNESPSDDEGLFV